MTHGALDLPTLPLPTHTLLATRGERRQAPVPSGLLVFFFGPDQKGLLKVQTFLKFLAQLHSDIAELEFMHYDVPGKGTMPGVDFARALVAVADIRQVDALLNKASACRLCVCVCSRSPFTRCAPTGPLPVHRPAAR